MTDFFDQETPEEPTASQGAGDESQARAKNAPLADRMRPRSFREWVGQEDVIGADSFLTRLMQTGSLPSLILWGPPGCGKTTLAGLIAREAKITMTKLSAVSSGIKEARAIIEAARRRLDSTAKPTILFVDEIHRFNKAQQDAFLPPVESGVVILFGATTENPSFSIIAPLLSRCRVLTLKQLDEEELIRILERALRDEERGLGRLNLSVDQEGLKAIAGASDGDARRALNLLEQSAAAARSDSPDRSSIDPALIANVAQRTHLLYDRSGEEHFNLISALHKSLRSSDPQAALYWLARMLLSGEDPLYIGRRLVRFASEDVGLADPQALPQALAGVQCYQMLGSPEGELGLVQTVIYLATAPKSNSLYAAWGSVKKEIDRSGSAPVPLHLRNAPTKLMKDLHYGRDYQYDHDRPDHFSAQRCLPEEIRGEPFYRPGSFGFEREIVKRLQWWDEKRGEASGMEAETRNK